MLYVLSGCTPSTERHSCLMNKFDPNLCHSGHPESHIISFFGHWLARNEIATGKREPHYEIFITSGEKTFIGLSICHIFSTTWHTQSVLIYISTTQPTIVYLNLPFVEILEKGALPMTDFRRLCHVSSCKSNKFMQSLLTSSLLK